MFDIEIDIDVDVDVGVEVIAVCSLLMLEDDPPLNKSIQEMELVYSPPTVCERIRRRTEIGILPRQNWSLVKRKLKPRADLPNQELREKDACG